MGEVELEKSDGFDLEDWSGRGMTEKLKSVGKLLFIIVCYAASFVSLVQMGFWLVDIPQFNPVIVPTHFTTWVAEKWRYGIWLESTTKAMFFNFGLLLAFCAQHTLMTQRVLDGSRYWMYIHYLYKIDRPIYVFATAVVMQGIVRLWQPVPILVWTLPWLTDYFHYVHILAWGSLYGTSLMLDLPDMVGFNQVVISTPTITRKSPELQMMYRVQRHLGFLPFLLILFTHPMMTLDRFMLTVCTLAYTYSCWRSTGCYEYASRMKQIKTRRFS